MFPVRILWYMCMIWLHVSTSHRMVVYRKNCGDSHVFLSFSHKKIKSGGITVQDEKEVKAGQEQTEEQSFWKSIKYEEEKTASDR